MSALRAALDGQADAPRHHLLSVLVENKVGVLARVAGLFSRRGFNIFSLAVAPTNDEGMSRIAIVVDVESAPLDQVMHQLDKLINVVSISQLAPDYALQRELLLATVSPRPGERERIIEVVTSFGAEVVDDSEGCIMVMLAGDPDAVDRFEESLEELEVVELQRTGRVALPKLS